MIPDSVIVSSGFPKITALLHLSRPEPARAAPWQAVWSRGYADGEFTAVVPSMGESITDGSLAALLKGRTAGLSSFMMSFCFRLRLSKAFVWTSS